MCISLKHCFLNLIFSWTFSFHHQVSLSLLIIPFDSPKISLATFRTITVISFHISLAHPCFSQTHSFANLVIKFLILSPFNCHHLIRGGNIARLLGRLNLIRTSITRGLCCVVTPSPGITLQFVQILLSELLIKKKSICDLLAPLLYVIRCSSRFLKQVLTILRS